MNTETATPKTAQQTITLPQVIDRLNAIVLERRHAYSEMSKKFTCYSEQLQTIGKITMLLAEASATESELQIVKAILQTAPLFMFIAPRSTYKIYYTYYSKLEALLKACYDYQERLVAK